VCFVCADCLSQEDVIIDGYGFVSHYRQNMKVSFCLFALHIYHFFHFMITAHSSPHTFCYIIVLSMPCVDSDALAAAQVRAAVAVDEVPLGGVHSQPEPSRHT
jgi:hypothetical protein